MILLSPHLPPGSDLAPSSAISPELAEGLPDSHLSRFSTITPDVNPIKSHSIKFCKFCAIILYIKLWMTKKIRRLGRSKWD
jgi:hypothetical protein